MAKRYIFDSLTAFLETAKLGTAIGKAVYSEGWAGQDAKTYAEALKLAEYGWPDGRKEVRAIADNLSLADKVHRQEIVYDVVGDCWDMGKAVAGEPECAMSFEDYPEEQNGLNIVKIIVNTAFSGGIDESIIRARGAAILALLEALETAGKRLELWAIFSENNGYDVRVCVKHSDETAQDDLIAFALAHPSFSRRFAHLVTGTGITPGNPIGITEECDLYIPACHISDKRWQSEGSMLAWITAELAKYGVKLEE
jgi:hypothetical protein